MKDKIIKLIVFIVVCIVIYFVIYNYTTQINHANKNNTYESNSKFEDYREDYVNKYIETLKNGNYAEGFSMLDDTTKKSFDNDLAKYSKSIKSATEIMNRNDKGLRIDFISELSMKKYDLIDYKLISTAYEYVVGDEVHYSEEFSLFRKFSLIEYSPNVYEINIVLY